jgi:hypothetical protein
MSKLIRSFIVRPLAVAVVASFVLACGSPDSSDETTSSVSSPFVGHYTFASGSIVLSCQGAPPMALDLTQMADGKPMHYFDDTKTGDSTFHHVDSNQCQFDFHVDGSVATVSGTACTVPDGRGSTTTWQADFLRFTLQPDDTLKIESKGTWGGCPTVLDGIARRQ